jgi:HKD family nuclease
MKWTLVAQGTIGEQSIGSALKSACIGLGLDRLDVAVAYATLQGIKALEMAVGGIPPKSRWLIGLDDAISQPEALDFLLNIDGAVLRLAAMAPAKRFHPKLYCFWPSHAEDRYVSAIGSGNMTLNGLRSNAETAVILTAESKLEVEHLRKQWDAVWRLGKDATAEGIDAYRSLYKQAKRQRKRIADLGVSPHEPEPDTPVEEVIRYNGDAASAQIAWLEAGSAPAGGRDLEFPKAMSHFFGLKRAAEDREFRMVNGQSFTLRFTERKDNQMWRLLFSSASIQASIGRDTLRPSSGGNRSDLAVVFRKINGTPNYDVAMLRIGSDEYKKILDTSKKAGGLFTTRNPGGRNFGFL